MRYIHTESLLLCNYEEACSTHMTLFAGSTVSVSICWISGSRAMPYVSGTNEDTGRTERELTQRRIRVTNIEKLFSNETSHIVSIMHGGSIQLPNKR